MIGKDELFKFAKKQSRGIDWNAEEKYKNSRRTDLDDASKDMMLL